SVHQGEPRVQSARRTRRHIGHRAPKLYPQSARTRSRLRRGVAEDGGRGSVTSLRALSTPRRLLPPCGGGSRRGVALQSAVAAPVATPVSALGATPHPVPPPQGGRER